MFTGLIQCVGIVASIEELPAGRHLQITAPALEFDRCRIGDSIAVNGVCLTAVGFTPSGFSADVSTETAACTTLGELSHGRQVNLELAMTLQSFVGGHLVAGHVDGVGRVTDVANGRQGLQLQIEVPAELSRYIARKGSVCVDGVSLTVNTVMSNKFAVQIIPHTLEKSIIASYTQGCAVNIEVDLVARYVERLMQTGSGSKVSPSGISKSFLTQHGYINEVKR